MTQALTIGSFDFGANQKALDFFEDVIAKAKGPDGYPDIDVIAVIHAYRNAPSFVQGLQGTGNLRGFVVKNSTGTRYPEVPQFLKDNGFPVLDWSKDEIKKCGAQLVKRLDSVLRPDKPFMIVDHGGYFAYRRDIYDHYPPDRLISITEYTENGHSRYKALDLTDRPVISVGRCEIKAAADEAAAKLVVQGAYHYMMSIGSYLFDETNTIGLIGHGRMGSVVANSISGNGFHYLQVSDIRPLASTRLSGLPYVDKNKICESSNILFCATGHNALEPRDYALLKDGTIIFTATSPDDELRLDWLVAQGIISLERSEGDTFEYKVKATGNRIYLPFNGESANITFASGVTSPDIYLPQAAQLVASVKLAQHSLQYSPGVLDLEERYQNLVAQIYGDHFKRQAEDLFHRPHSVRTPLRPMPQPPL